MKGGRLQRADLLRALIALLFLLPMLAAVTGCRRGGEPGTLVMAIESPPRGFDPRFSSGNGISARTMQLIYDTLVVKGTNFDLVPSLAESFEESTDQQTFTFRLRPGVVFHDGKPLTSADVKYTFDSIISPATKSPLMGGFSKVASIDTPDPLTVIFRMREPFYTFMGNLPAIGIIPEGAGGELISAPVGTGPFRFVSYAEGDGIRLEANQNYWGGPPNIPRLRIKVVTDNSTRQAELMSGDVDLAYNAQFDPETIRALTNRSDIRVVMKEGAGVDYMGVNVTSNSPLSNPKLRQAVSYAIDREVIIERLLRRQAREADAIMPPEHWAFNPNVTHYEYNPERARQLLDEAGAVDPDGDGPQTRFSITLMTQTTQLSRNIASIIQDQLRRVGIHLNLESLEFATFMDRIGKLQFDLYFLRAIGFNQSTDVFQFVYHSRYQNPEFNDAIGKLRAANDPAAMQPLFANIAGILARRDYCPNGEVDRLAEQAAGLSNQQGAAQKKQIYLKISSLLTDRGGQNRMRYCNPQVDQGIAEAERAVERPAKIDLYGRLQKTISDELPQIYLWYPANVLVARSRVGGIEIEPSGSWFFISKLTLEEGNK